MPDTGAPWNIPYVESTDLVSDWPTDSLALANAIDAGLDAAGNAGIGSNVVQIVKTDAFATSSTSFVDVTGLSLSFTPTSATSKVLLIANLFISQSDGTLNHRAYSRLMRGATVVAGVGEYDAAGNNSFRNAWSHSVAIIDSPASTSAQNYHWEVRANFTSAYVNREWLSSTAGRYVSSIVAIEVAA